VLVESLPCVYEMEEMLYELGTLCGRPQRRALGPERPSMFEYVMGDPKAVWPDRFGVDIKTTPFLANIFRRLSPSVSSAAPCRSVAWRRRCRARTPRSTGAAESIRKDKEWEAQQGFIRAWVAHIFHMKTAADPFRQLIASGWKPTPRWPTRALSGAARGAGRAHHVEGTRRNARMLIEYVEGWLNGRGAKGIDSLRASRAFIPALMEDLATGRMSVAQIAQRIRHAARTTRARPPRTTSRWSSACCRTS
jgi:malate synthase